MNEVLSLSVFLGLLNASIIILMLKWRVYEYIETYHFQICIYCFGFWLACGEVVILIASGQIVTDPALFFIPFVSAFVTSRVQA